MTPESRRLAFLGLACAALCAAGWIPRVAAQRAAALPASQSAATYLPESVVAAVTLDDGDRRLHDIRDLLAAYGVFDSPLYQRISTTPQFMQAQLGVLGLAASAKSDPWDAGGALLGRQLAIGLVPRPGKQPAAILVSVLRNPELADQLLKALHALAGLERPDGPDPARSTRYATTTIFSVSPELHHCRLDGALLVSNDAAALRSAIDARHLEQPSLAQSEVYRAAADRRPDDALAWLFADLEAFRAGLAKEGKLQDKMDNPLGGFLFGGVARALLDASDLTAWVRAQDATLSIDARVRPAAAPGEAYRGFRAALDVPAVTLQGVRRYLSETRVSRDWAALFSERETLLTLPAASQVVGFNTTVSTLLGGLDFMHDLLPRVKGPVQFLTAQQDFSGARDLPTPKLPAFALVAPLAMDESYAARLFSGALSTVSLINFDQAQKGLPCYLLDLEDYRGQRVLVTRLADPSAAGEMKMDAPGGSAPPPSSPPAGDASPDKAPDAAAAAAAPDGPRRADIRYNFAPSFALVADHMIIATSRDLLHDVADALLGDGSARRAARGPPQPDNRCRAAAAPPTRPSRIACIWTCPRWPESCANRQELIVNRMLEKDLPRATAEQDVDQFLAILDYFRALEMTLARTEDGYQARIELMLASRPAQP